MQKALESNFDSIFCLFSFHDTSSVNLDPKLGLFIPKMVRIDIQHEAIQSKMQNLLLYAFSAAIRPMGH